MCAEGGGFSRERERDDLINVVDHVQHQRSLVSVRFPCHQWHAVFQTGQRSNDVSPGAWGRQEVEVRKGSGREVGSGIWPLALQQHRRRRKKLQPVSNVSFTPGT